MPLHLRLSKNLWGGIGGPKPSNFRSKTSDMCGGFRRNFEEISTLPEQTAAQRRSLGAVKRGKNSKKWQRHFFDTLGRGSLWLPRLVYSICISQHFLIEFGYCTGA